MEIEKALEILNATKVKKYTAHEATKVLEFLTILARISINNLIKK